MSAFGISGTNSHVVVEGYGEANGGMQLAAGSARPVALPESLADLPQAEERRTRLLPLSGKAEGALRELAGCYLSWLDECDEEAMLADMAWTAGVGRSHFDYRAGVVFSDAASLRDGLKMIADKRLERVAATKVAFAFTGEGSEWVGMGQVLYDSEPVVRAVLDRCDEILREERGASLLDVMFGRTEGAEWARPAVYALECALTALWASVGIRPSAVVGQGLGELAAAQAGGGVWFGGGVAVCGGSGRSRRHRSCAAIACVCERCDGAGYGVGGRARRGVLAAAGK